MNITATHINYLNVCKRKLWLFSNAIQMEHTSDIVYDGKVIHETSYNQRSDRYTQVDLRARYEDHFLFGKIDFYDPRQKIVHETKRSKKMESAHEWQAKFYLWILSLNDIQGATAILEYPMLRQTTRIILTDEDIMKLRTSIVEIVRLTVGENCPLVINASICKRCSYYELCYIRE